MTQPYITCLCCTFCRPALLEEALESFLRQDYPLERRELLILDDADQYPNLAGNRWQLISVPRRFLTLAEKSNALAAMASRATDVYAIWDDDDIYLPWHLSAIAGSIEHADWTLPSSILTLNADELALHATQGLFHSSWAFRREVFASCGGYPFIEAADQALARRFNCETHIRRADTCENFPPSVIYRWSGHGLNWHVSEKPGNYEMLVIEQREIITVKQLRPRWTRAWDREAKELFRDDQASSSDWTDDPTS